MHLDFETYSEAGFYFDGRWQSVAGGQQGGLPAVGAAVYAEHPSTEVLIACYQAPNGSVQTWVPGMPNPIELLEHVKRGGLVYANNSMFEWLIWDRVCRRRYGWPPLLLQNTRDTAALARAYGLPGALAKSAAALGLMQQKDTAGTNLIRRFSIPRSPSKNNLRLRNYMGEDPENAYRFYSYCAQDVVVESEVNRACPQLSAFELEVWKLDQEINARGIKVDLAAIEDCQFIVKALSGHLTEELQRITNGRVKSIGQVAEIPAMLADYGIRISDMQAETIQRVLRNPNHSVHRHPWAKRVLEIRRDLASASVKKLDALKRRACSDGRVRDSFVYCGAERTGRWSGKTPQPQNFPRGDASVAKCESCGIRQGKAAHCYRCRGVLQETKWNFDTAVQALESFRTRNVDDVIRRWGDVLGVMAGSLRSLFVAAPGYRFIASDYRAIEAVVLAALAGEEWRLEVFRTHGKIYEQSASKITGIPFEEYLDYKRRTGEHHPTRQTIGKVAELASGYQGGLGAWRVFGAGEHLSDDDIKAAIQKWRAESPSIVRMWYGLENAAIGAVENKGVVFPYRQIRYHYDGKVLRCYLPSGRPLVYHSPRVEPAVTPWGSSTKRISFRGYNSNPKYGDMGWRELDTYGGKLTENVVQATSRDLLAHGMINAAKAGYRIVLHVHDEIVCEEPEGRGSVQELESLMGDLPEWAKGWPVIAQGGWEGHRYRKD